MIDFDADTALEPIAEGRWRGVIPASWDMGFGPNGGFLAALGARAAELVAPHPLSSLTIHYLEAPKFGPVEVTAEVTREGRSASFARLRMEQDGRLVGQAGAVCTQWRTEQPEWSDAAPPELPPVDECVRIDPTRSRVSPLIANYDMRVGVADPDARPSALRGWIRTAEPRTLDRPLLAAYTDAFMPPALVRTRFQFHVRVPTLELTIHFRDLPPEGEHPWVIGSFVTRLSKGGTLEEDGELWTPDGRLLVMSRQLALVRTIKK